MATQKFKLIPLNKRIVLAIALFLVIHSTSVMGQDVQFSQFYSAPLYLNPAFTGATQLTRVGTNYRSQWPALQANFVTLSAYVDHFIDDKNSGIGFLIQTDKEGLAGLRSTSFTGTYSYQLPISETFTFRVGANAGYYLRDINFSNLTFGDQFVDGVLTNPTGEQFNTGAAKSFFNVGTGALLYSNDVWLGLAVDHLNKPNQSLIGEEDKLSMKFSVHGGYKFKFASGVTGQGMYTKPQERSLTPTFQYKQQGKFSQIDLGMYYTFEPIVFGLWYRGVPYKPVDGVSNNESVVVLLGFNKRTKDSNFKVGYSYDITISKLGSSSGGAHEFSLSYAWFTGDPRKPPKNVRLIPCPDI